MPSSCVQQRNRLCHTCVVPWFASAVSSVCCYACAPQGCATPHGWLECRGCFQYCIIACTAAPQHHSVPTQHGSPAVPLTTNPLLTWHAHLGAACLVVPSLPCCAVPLCRGMCLARTAEVLVTVPAGCRGLTSARTPSDSRQPARQSAGRQAGRISCCQEGGVWRACKAVPLLKVGMLAHWVAWHGAVSVQQPGSGTAAGVQGQLFNTC